METRAAPTIGPATADDLDAIRSLLDAAGLPTADLAPGTRVEFRVARSGERVVAAIGLERHGTAGLLRSLVVAPEHRGTGVGGALVDALERDACASGVRELWLLTQTAERFFAARGWRPAERAAAPASIRESAEFSALCPASAACLTRSLAVTIWHNPACGTSRNTLALIRNAGVEPDVVEYLRSPPDRATLVDLMSRAGLRPRELLREKGTPYAELGLGAPGIPDAALVDRMLEHPILINRPLVATPWGVRLCRPSERVLEILPLPQRGPFAKEDGEVVVGADRLPVR
jgi:arsenate reductase